MQKINPLARKNNLVIQELDNEILIYDLETNKVFGLNETSALVWQYADGKRTTEEIAQIISKKKSCHVGEEFIWLVLEKLDKEKLVENGSLENSPLKGMKRREIIKKAGLATLIALPVIMSLTTPKAVQSASLAFCAVVACDCTIMFSSPMTTCSSIADCMTDIDPACMCSNLTCTGSGAGNVSCSGVCGA